MKNIFIWFLLITCHVSLGVGIKSILGKIDYDHESLQHILLSADLSKAVINGDTKRLQKEFPENSKLLAGLKDSSVKMVVAQFNVNKFVQENNISRMAAIQHVSKLIAQAVS